jgi:hypothetical protein
MILQSDFEDYYDKVFNGFGAVYYRMKSEEPDKKTLLDMADGMGAKIIECGTPRSLYIKGYNKVVINKKILDIGFAMEYYGGKICTPYKDNEFVYKLVTVGDRSYTALFEREKGLKLRLIRVNEAKHTKSNIRSLINSVDCFKTSSGFEVFDVNLVQKIDFLKDTLEIKDIAVELMGKLEG